MKTDINKNHDCCHGTKNITMQMQLSWNTMHALMEMIHLFLIWQLLALCHKLQGRFELIIFLKIVTDRNTDAGIAIYLYIFLTETADIPASMQLGSETRNRSIIYDAATINGNVFIYKYKCHIF